MRGPTVAQGRLPALGCVLPVPDVPVDAVRADHAAPTVDAGQRQLRRDRGCELGRDRRPALRPVMPAHSVRPLRCLCCPQRAQRCSSGACVPASTRRSRQLCPSRRQASCCQPFTARARGARRAARRSCTRARCCARRGACTCAPQARAALGCLAHSRADRCATRARTRRRASQQAPALGCGVQLGVACSCDLAHERVEQLPQLGQVPLEQQAAAVGQLAPVAQPLS